MVYSFTDLYGVVRGEFLDGTGWIPPDDYVYQERPWYLAAKEGGRNIENTDPYASYVSPVPGSKEIVAATSSAVSYSTELFDSNGESVGVLSVDVSLNALADYIETVRPIRVAKDGYGILLDTNLVIIAHHDNGIEGQGIETVNDDNIRLAEILRKDKKVDAFRMTNSEGVKVIAFFKQIFNGWYVGVVTPERSYYNDVYRMAALLSIIGFVLMLTLMILLYRLQARIRAYIAFITKLNRSTMRFVPVQFMEHLGVDNISTLRAGDCVQRNFTVMFFDVRFFSILSEMMSPNQSFEFINRILKIAGPIIRKHNGFVDKYLGDAVMALFNSGRGALGARDAVNAGIEIYQKIVLDKVSDAKAGKDRVNIGIGLHSGLVMMGIIGENERLSGTVISEHVNMASRIEGLTKQVKSGMLISSTVMRQITEKEAVDFETRYLGLIQPAGVNEIVGIFDILETLPPSVRARRIATRDAFESGVRNFHMKDFDTAAQYFQEVVDTDKSDSCARHHLAEAQKRIQHPSLPAVFIFAIK
jgi:class 3 adenylate cyclase